MMGGLESPAWVPPPARLRISHETCKSCHVPGPTPEMQMPCGSGRQSARWALESPCLGSNPPTGRAMLGKAPRGSAPRFAPIFQHNGSPAYSIFVEVKGTENICTYNLNVSKHVIRVTVITAY